MATTLKTLVLKTATVKSVKLGTPADRIGLGRMAVAMYPADVLSSGQFPMPPRPDSNSNPDGHRQALSADLMREHRAEMAASEPPASLAGRDVPGSSAHRWPASFTQTCVKPTKRSMSRVSFPAVSCVCERIGDCQSPDRRDDRQTASMRETNPTAAAAI